MTQIKTRKLGGEGFDVSEVGLGCWQIGGDWGDTSDATSQEILQAAHAAGVTFFDTADVYGGGQSERALGQFLRNLPDPDRPKVATKFGRGGGVFPDGYTKDAMREGVESSLERLGLSKLDLVQLHCIPTDVLRQGDVFDWLRDLQSEGLVAHFGASVETIEEGLIAIQQDGLLSLQVIFNAFRQRLVQELLPQAEAKGVGIIARLPLASGVLSGKFTKDTTFPENDHRNYNRDGAAFNVGETFAGIPFEKAVELVDGLKGDLPQGLTMAEVANRWILDHRAVSTIIPGASHPAQIQRNAAVSALAPLDPAYTAALRDYYDANVAPHIRGPY
ncbi:aldo/keto reductase [Yoonia sp. R2331]|uniref:aldo/keto reductase n=1 Tax=Yoonia sp. R2331 TaxID=3237238 RepID=UPI0034E4AFC5